MQYLKVRNWDKWQTYRSDRGKPPWIKIHRCLQQDWEWVDLSDKHRGQLVAIWLLASSRDGVIPASPEKVQKLCNMSDLPDLNLLIELNFLEGAAIVASTGCQEVVTDKIREVKLSEVKVSKDTGRFTPPVAQEIQIYASEKNLNIIPEDFIDFYESKGWMVGKNKMKVWKAAARRWSKLQNQRGNTNGQTSKPHNLTAVERVAEAGRRQIEQEQRNAIIDITPHEDTLG